MSQFYSYIHALPNGRVFYVGKGKGDRAYNFRGRSEYHQNVINKHGSANILVGKLDCSSESTAFELEKGLIKCFRRMGVVLTNRTDGGDGATGLVHSEKTRKALGALFNCPEHVEKHSKAVKEAHVRSKDKYRKSAKESQNWPEVLAKHREYQGSVGVRKAKAIRSRAFWADAERSLAVRTSIKSALSRPEVKARQSAALLGKNSGKISVMRGAEHRMITPEVFELYVSKGWVRGNPKSKGRQTTKGRYWVTNLDVNRMVYPEEAAILIALGWTRGRK